MTDDHPTPTTVTARAGYAMWAARYDAHDNPLTAMVEHVVSQRAPDLRGARVIELGCGTGRNALAAHALGCAQYTGIDDSPEMLAIARERAGARDDVTWLERDLRGDWTAELSGFDAALISLVLEHLEDVRPILGALDRVVRPGGTVWIVELHPALHAGGVRAHVAAGDRTLTLPSVAHTAGEIVDALGDGWAPESITDWYATDTAVRRSAKLARYLGRPVVLDVRARRRG